MQRLGRLLDRGVAAILQALKWLAIPICLLLFLQWPLREFFRAYSREANDLGQWLFALYIAGSVTAATRAHTHLATDALARRYSPRVRRWLSRFGGFLALAPWAVFIVISATPTILAALSATERFPDTGNPGYFIVKLALWLLAGLVLASLAVDLMTRDEGDR
jgi:TRAP-type mannitol/chloroaromatic compound transport system permease small subunit